MTDQAPARRDIPWMAITVVLALLTVAGARCCFSLAVSIRSGKATSAICVPLLRRSPSIPTRR